MVSPQLTPNKLYRTLRYYPIYQSLDNSPQIASVEPGEVILLIEQQVVLDVENQREENHYNIIYQDIVGWLFLGFGVSDSKGADGWFEEVLDEPQL